jgi:hypothetical protein
MNANYLSKVEHYSTQIINNKEERIKQDYLIHPVYSLLFTTYYREAICCRVAEFRLSPALDKVGVL